MASVTALKKRTDLETLLDKYANAKEPVFINTSMTSNDARLLLEENTNNRHLNDVLVKKYAGIMRVPGKWVINGETIKIAKTGRLLDGQHRMHALLEVDKPVPMTLCLGLPESDFKTIDTGRSRTAGDILHMAGFKNWNFLAAAMRYMLIYQADESWRPHFYDLAPQDILEGAQRWPRMEDMVKSAYKVKHIMSISRAAFFMYVASHVDPDLAWDFFLRMETGEELKKTDGLLQYRDLMMKYRAQQVTPDKRNSLAYLILAWNSFYNDEPVKSIKWDASKPFPQIAGVNRKTLFKKNSI